MPRAAESDILVATMPDVRPLASLLKSISFKTRATLKIDDIGIRLVVEEGRSIQANAFIAQSCFSTYQWNLSPDSPSAFFDMTPAPDAPDVESDRSTPVPGDDDEDDEEAREEKLRRRGPPHCEMVISLSTMLECLNIFGNAGVSSSNPFKKDYDDDGGDTGRKRARGGDRDDDEDGGNHRGKNRRESGASGGNEEKQTSLRLSYKGVGEPLIMLLEESGIVTRCELTTYEPDGLLDLKFSDEERVQKLIMKSEWLRDALLELPPTSDKLSISFWPHPLDVDEDEQPDEEDRPPLFRLEATGANGSTEMDYSDNKDIVETFECEMPLRNSYKFSHIQLTKHALANSIKASIRTDEYGLLSFQFMIPLSDKAAIITRRPGGIQGGAPSGSLAFVEFMCVALDE